VSWAPSIHGVVGVCEFHRAFRTGFGCYYRTAFGTAFLYLRFVDVTSLPIPGCSAVAYTNPLLIRHLYQNMPQSPAPFSPSIETRGTPREPGRGSAPNTPGARKTSSLKLPIVSDPPFPLSPGARGVKFDGASAASDDDLPGTVVSGRGERRATFTDEHNTSSLSLLKVREASPSKSGVAYITDDAQSVPDTMQTGSQNSMDEETDAMSASSANRTTREAGMTIFRCCGLKIAIPFTAWTFLAMAVPVAFVVGIVSQPLAHANHQLDVISRLSPLADIASACVSSQGVEYIRTVRMLRGFVTEDELTAARLETKRDCGDGWMTLVRELSAEDSTFEPVFDTSFASAQQAAVMRSTLTGFMASPDFDPTAAATTQMIATVRDTFATLSSGITSGVALAADELETDDVRYFLNYKLVADLRMSLYFYIATGYSLGGAANATAASLALTRAQFDHAMTRGTVVMDAAKTLSTPSLRAQIDTWATSEGVGLLVNEIVRAYTDPASTDTQAILKYGTESVNILRGVESAQIDELREAEESRRAVTVAAVLATVSIFACIVAAALLAWQQFRVQAQLQSQVERVDRTRRAVSAFVPKFFLAKMGYTSITQVRVGESTNVALAMLFADVRRFTTVSEGMSCEDLFAWVQEYFRRMTTVVDSRNGNINQFIGDGLFAVFSSARDSVRCAVDMQSDVQQLNVERLCEQGNNVPIEIGVGLHHDVLAMGILGDDRRHTCTAISASVNLASRLDGLTKQLGCRILASQAVMDQLPPGDAASVHHRRIGTVVVKGSSREVVVYDVFQADDRSVQEYKAATKTAFEAVGAELLVPGDRAALELALQSRLDSLRGEAERFGVTDRALSEMVQRRDGTTGHIVFDLK
jgi:class 3 adenylate cyclase